MATTLSRERVTVEQLEHDGRVVTIQFITPAMAKEMLRRNHGNRSIREASVRSYARDMSLGCFPLADQAICFNDEGDLTQGQHRLEACMLAGVGFWSLVMRGTGDADRLTADTGVRRTVGDVITWRFKETPGVARAFSGAAQLAMRYEQADAVGANIRFSVREVITWIEEHPSFRESVELAQRARHSVQINGSALAVAHYFTAREDQADADEFVALLVSGEGLFAGNPILALRKWCHAAASDRARPTTPQYLAVTLKAMNAWREGREAKILKWHAGGANPEPFPKVWVRR